MADKDVASNDALQFPVQEGRYDAGIHQRTTQGFHRAVHNVKERQMAAARQYSFLDWLGLVFPCVRWLRNYRIKEYLLYDFCAGLSIGAMVVPQGLSYATLAGLPSVYGLYGAFIPCIVYSLFGSSKQLAVGPVAVTSLLISNGLKDIVKGSSEIDNPNRPTEAQLPIQAEYNVMAIQLAFLVAVLYTSVGLFRLGFLTRFLSHSVISGFTSGAACTIGLSQFKYLLGYKIPQSNLLQDQTKAYVEGLPAFMWQEWIMGGWVLILLIWIKLAPKIWPKIRIFRIIRPLGALIACVIGIVAVVIGNLDKKGVNIVATIPSGLPGPTADLWFPMARAGELLPLAVLVMFVDLLESTSIARALALKNGYQLNYNQEIIGLGLANFGGALFSCYSTTGSFSRSAVNNEAGARTPLAQFVTGWVVAFVLLVLTSVFEKIPYNVIGAIIVAGVAGLFDWEGAVVLGRARLLDLLVWCASFFGVLFAGVEWGLAIAVVLALIIVIFESAFPKVPRLGKISKSTVYRNVEQYPDSEQIPGIVIVRIDASVYFANEQFIHDQIIHYEGQAAGTYSSSDLDSGSDSNAAHSLRFVILDLTPVGHMDAAGMHMLEDLRSETSKKGIQLVLVNPNHKLMRIFERTGFLKRLTQKWIFVRVHDAVQFCSQHLQESGGVASYGKSI